MTLASLIYSDNTFTKSIPLVPNPLSENDVLNEDPAKLKLETFHEISTVEVGAYALIEVGNKDVRNNAGVNSNSQPVCPAHTYQNIGSVQPDKTSPTQKVRYVLKL